MEGEGDLAPYIIAEVTALLSKCMFRWASLYFPMASNTWSQQSRDSQHEQDLASSPQAFDILDTGCMQGTGLFASLLCCSPSTYPPAADKDIPVLMWACLASSESEVAAATLILQDVIFQSKHFKVFLKVS